MKFVKILTKAFLLGILAMTIIVVGFLCPCALIIVGIIMHSIWLILGGLIWLCTSACLYVCTEDEVDKQIKEDFKI